MLIANREQIFSIDKGSLMIYSNFEYVEVAFSRVQVLRRNQNIAEVSMTNIPEVRLGVIAVSRDCFSLSITHAFAAALSFTLPALTKRSRSSSMIASFVAPFR